MKTALYRKYRPRSFADVVGQDAVCEALKNQIASGRFGHSYLFTGIRGTGKTTLARILAKAVNCTDVKDGEPCGACDVCAGVDDGTMLDVTEIDAASNSGVDSIRELREETAFTPNVCRFRVYIIDEVHMLSKEAWAALLKIMEEPPAHVIFILATTEIHRVPATILSRCQRFDLRRIPKEKIAALIGEIARAEGIPLEADGADIIARLADGAVRDALSLLDTCASLGVPVDAACVARMAGVADKSYLASLADDIGCGDAEGLFRDLRALYESSIDPVRLCGELLRRFRDLLALGLAGEDALDSETPEELASLASQRALFDTPTLFVILDELTRAADKLAYAPDRTLALELALVRLCGMKSEARGDAKTTAEPAPKRAEIKHTPSAADNTAAAKKQPAEPAPRSGQPQREPDDSPAEPDDAPPWVESAQAGAEGDIQSDGLRTQGDDKPAEPAPQSGQPPREPEDSPAETDDAPPWDAAETNTDDTQPLSDEGGEDDDLFENVKRAASAAPAPPCDTTDAPKPDAPQVAPDGLELFERWGETLEAIRAENPMVYGFLGSSRAYLDGTRLLIDERDKFFVIKNDRARLAEIERAVRETTGLKLRVAAYEPPEAERSGGARAELDDIFARAELNNITIDEITSQ